MPISILKSSGESVPFDERKLVTSLERSGASSQRIKEILQKVTEELYEGISTKKIYKRAFSLLRKGSAGEAGRYKLRNGIMELGPTGFPFERFMGTLMAYQGYDVQVDVVKQGHSVTHEIDVWAERGNEVIMVECKYHQRADIKCDVKVPMYILSRHMDVKREWDKNPENKGKTLKVHIATNTQFTKDASDFARTYNITLIGWSYPEKGNLREWIDHSGLYPLTCLSSLSKTDKRRLLEQDVVLIRDLLQSPLILNSVGISERKKSRVLREARDMCAKC